MSTEPWTTRRDDSGGELGLWSVIDSAGAIVFFGLEEDRARLIAATPDLLDALKSLVGDVEEYERINNLAPNPGRKRCWISVDQAHAAIAKAEGKP